MSEKTIIGSTEIISIPDLNLYDLDVKIDTGADSNALHCDDIFIDENNIVHFKLLDEVHPAYHGKEMHMPLYEMKKIKSSNGEVQQRPSIKTKVEFFGKKYTTVISLTNRSDMKYPMLLGKKFLKKFFLVDISQEYLSKPHKKQIVTEQPKEDAAQKQTAIRLYILSRNKKLYSTRRLVQAAEQRGWEVKVIDYLKCSIEIMKDDLKVNYLGKELPKPDAIIPRIGASRTFYGTAMVRHFEMMDVFTTTGSLAIKRSRDKLRSLQILSKNGIDLPKTVFASNKSSTKDVIALSGGAPLILKILEGTQGVGVVLVESEKAAKSVLDAFYGMDVNLLIQEYIKESGGSDIRAFVVGGKIVGAMKRQGTEGDFRSNLHQGGKATAHKLTKKEKETALAAAKAMGLNVCGVDMIPSVRGPLVMEVNSSPGLEGIEKSTNIDIASKIMDYIEKNVMQKNKVLTKKSKIKKDSIGA